MTEEKDPSDVMRDEQPPQETPQACSSQPEAAGPPSQSDGPNERKAMEYTEQAEKKIKSATGFLGNLFGGPAKMEEAADLYVKAANAYKIAKKHTAAGNAFRKAAEIHFKLDTKHEGAAILADAGQVLKKDSPKEAVECYQRAIEVYTDMGKFSMAARYHTTIAEICEGDLADYEAAMRNYETAADYFKAEDSTASADKCVLKVAHMAAQLQMFDKAVQIFEEVARNSLENTLRKYSAKEYFFKAAVCNFSIQSYQEMHPGFQGTRELKLIESLLEAYDEADVDKFSDCIKDYDSISRIDQWLTVQLLHIKRTITSGPDIN
eukprot:Em0019g168a